ncbi:MULTISPECIES: YafY family protein [unclassified Colwellia]|jgi:predicted DNA-binding transcriptional regulator YafY|uniref:helix-turn-helix transcriptional regulator n=1 Tax=unclassified Colwellia TaxID=196834 RepID=UPI0015F3B7F6|nr:MULTISPECIES: WYL domain-containing protein [unclassified Colwellia]MBA6224299.1 WYL domain-containing protein [Colwellia sp. MB3u-45]MBA6265869.1 WYL domain-containing protein [Colwellia sp. MB3u-43]MBA6288439.1 WYL domain-containing protein [Colwellia sp. MB3u-4]MBA6295952.1 WYL domain-containing protein [Colwellia sp. MB02u-9]MBA6321549.1 WYL domain-containing protein [Colwellia sp. MB02u-19]
MPTAKSKTLVRVMSMMQLIPVYPRWTTAKRLLTALDCRGFSVSKRTVERDLVELGDVFSLISIDSPEGFKWSYAKDNAQAFLPAISAEEALSLHLVERHLKNHLPLSVYQQLDAVFKKSADVLNSAARISTWPNKVASLPHGLYLSPVISDENIQSTISQGLLEQRKLDICYGKSVKVHTITPLGLIVRDTKLVLVCYFYQYDEPRHLLVHRVRNAILLNETFESDFNAKDYLKKNSLDVVVNGEKVVVKMRVRGYAKRLLNESEVNASQEIESDDDTWDTVTISLLHTLELENWILSQSQDIQIIEPLQLKSRVIRRLLKSIENYDLDEPQEEYVIS